MAGSQSTATCSAVQYMMYTGLIALPLPPPFIFSVQADSDSDSEKRPSGGKAANWFLHISELVGSHLALNVFPMLSRVFSRYSGNSINMHIRIVEDSTPGVSNSFQMSSGPDH